MSNSDKNNIIQIGDGNAVNSGIGQPGISAISGSNTTVIHNIIINQHFGTPVGQSSFDIPSTSKILSTVLDDKLATSFQKNNIADKPKHNPTIDENLKESNWEFIEKVSKRKSEIPVEQSTSDITSQSITKSTLPEIKVEEKAITQNIASNELKQNPKVVESIEAPKIVDEIRMTENSKTRSVQNFDISIGQSSNDNPITTKAISTISVKVEDKTTKQYSTVVKSKPQTEENFNEVKIENLVQTTTQFIGSIDIKPNPKSNEIFEAVKIGDEKSIRKFIGSGGDVNTKNDNGNTLIETAAEHGQLPIVKYLESNGANILTKTPPSDTLLHIVAAHGDIECIKHFIQAGINKDVLNEEGQTPLHVSARNGHLTVIKYLVEIGVDALASCKEGRTALHYATFNGNEDCVRWILSNTKLDINREDTADYSAPIHIAAKEGHLNIIKVLLEFGAELCLHSFNRNIDYSESVLDIAAFYGHMKCVQYLIESDEFYVNDTKEYIYRRKIYKNYCNPICKAAEGGHLNIVKYLVELGADIFEKNKLHKTALHSASKGGNEGCANYLINQGIEVNCTDTMGETPVLLASKMGHLNILKLLHSKGAVMNIKDYFKRTALHYAARGGYLDCLMYLMECGLDVNAKDCSFQTPLFMASQSGNLQVIKFLVESSANILDKTKYNETMLHAAIKAEIENDDTVQYFITKGLDVNAKTNYLYLCAYYGHEKIFNSLIDAGAKVDSFVTNSPLFAAVQQQHFHFAKILLEKYCDINFAGYKGQTLLHHMVKEGNSKAVEFLVNSGANIFDENTSGETAVDIAIKYNKHECSKILTEQLSKK